MAERFPELHGRWGVRGTRVALSEDSWRDPIKWDREAAAAGERHRVFCLSMGDLFDAWRGQVIDHNGRPLGLVAGDGLRFAAGLEPELTLSALRRRVFRLISITPNLDWLVLTKRPQNAEPMIRDALGLPARDPNTSPVEEPGEERDDAVDELAAALQRLHNFWLGVSVESNEYAWRIDELAKVPARVKFVSAEPLVGPVDDMPLEKVDWVIAGGESGSGSRPMHPAWVRNLRDRCVEQGVPFFMKQWGNWAPYEDSGNGDFVAPDGDVVEGEQLPERLWLGTPTQGWWAPFGMDVAFRNLGKKGAGRLLDGREWNEFPTPVTADGAESAETAQTADAAALADEADQAEAA